MDDREFAAEAERTLQRLQDAVERALADDDPEIELRGGILMIELAGGGQFIVNKHAPTRQIWVSSPVSGAAHYSWDKDAGCWRSTRSADILETRLAADLAQATGRPVSIA